MLVEVPGEEEAVLEVVASSRSGCVPALTASDERSAAEEETGEADKADEADGEEVRSGAPEEDEAWVEDTAEVPCRDILLPFPAPSAEEEGSD